MMGDPQGLIEWAAALSALVLLLSMGLGLIRLVKGPTLADRAVALDLITVLAIAFAGVAAVASGSSALLDVGVALALVAFLATLAFAWYIERRAERPSAESPEEG